MNTNREQTIKKLFELYGLGGSIVEIKEVENGHINTTLNVTTESEGCRHRYIVQKINSRVFCNPRIIMDNIREVSDWIENKTRKDGCRAECSVLTFYRNLGGENFARLDDSESYWRIADFIDGTVTYEQISDSAMMKRIGAAFGAFQKLLSDMPAEKLSETIPDFHNTKKRLDDFFAKVEEDPRGRAASVAEEIAFFREYAAKFSELERLRLAGILPVRIIHNDTKCNNILFDALTGEPKTVIDLDTVMPGLSAYDFGDAVRCAANYAAEDETDLSRVGLNMDYYRAFTDGFIGTAKSFLTDNEIKYMSLGAPTITFELASRFLYDYIDGDKYFRIHREGQNLDRARCQIALCKDMMNKSDEMNEIIESCRS